MLRQKAIAEGRDRAQSRALVAVVGAALAVSSVYVLFVSGAILDFRASVGAALVLSLTFGFAAWRLRAATKWAAAWGSLICLLLTMSSETPGNPLRSGMSPLFFLFVLTFAATRLGRRRKTQMGVAEEKRGRNAAQILANLGMAGLVVSGAWIGVFDGIGPGGFVGFSFYAMPVLMLAALCEATADTVSSEIGQAFGGMPFLLTTWRRVEVGSDGAVTLLGTAAGVGAAMVVAGVGMWGMRLTAGLAGVGLAGGVAGLGFDSLLGGTLERKGWVGNDLVNFLSTGFAVGVGLGLVMMMRQG